MTVIRWMHSRITAQVPLALGRLLGKDVAQVSLRALEAAASERLETLCGAALGLEFWHLLLLAYFSLTPGVPCRALCCLGITCFDDWIVPAARHYFFFGLITMTICRPSIFGNCSTTP